MSVLAPDVPPKAAFTTTATDLALTADGSTSSDPDGTVASYAWNFGDGTTGTGATASHTYAAAGSYTVTLTVTDDRGATNAVSRSVTVRAPNKAPVAAFTSSATDLTATFDGSGSSDPDGTIASYAWDFGDGASASTAKAAHTYAAGGSYTVKLTVTDDRGGRMFVCSDTDHCETRRAEGHSGTGLPQANWEAAE